MFAILVTLYVLSAAAEVAGILLAGHGLRVGWAAGYGGPIVPRPEGKRARVIGAALFILGVALSLLANIYSAMG